MEAISFKIGQEIKGKNSKQVVNDIRIDVQKAKK